MFVLLGNITPSFDPYPPLINAHGSIVGELFSKVTNEK